MPIGVLVNSAALLVGGILGALLKERMPARLKDNLTMIFGLCAFGMGLTSAIGLKNLPAVVLSIILGTVIGMLLRVEDRVTALVGKLQKPLGRIMNAGSTKEEQDAYMGSFLTVLVLFCASATGLYGSLDSGMTGDHTMLITKSILDFFTAAIFACSLGYMVSLIFVPQLCIFLVIFYLAKVIMPLTTPEMIADFRGCGGFLLLATGLRLMKIRNFPLLDMVPALILAMPVSWLWMNFILPLL